MNRQLYEHIRRYESNITASEVDLFLENHKSMRSAQMDFAKTKIKKSIVEMALNVYGREPDDAHILATTTNIFRKYQDLSYQDIVFVLDQMTLGNIEPGSKYFNPTGILKILNQFQGRKKIIMKAFHTIRRHQNESAEGRAAYDHFLNGARRKYGNEEILTYYEKSSLGKLFAETMNPETVKVVRESARLNFEAERKRVDRQREVFYSSILTKENNSQINEEMQFPMAITEEMYFGSLAFEQYVQLKK